MGLVVSALGDYLPWPPAHLSSVIVRNVPRTGGGQSRSAKPVLNSAEDIGGGVHNARQRTDRSDRRVCSKTYHALWTRVRD